MGAQPSKTTSGASTRPLDEKSTYQTSAHQSAVPTAPLARLNLRDEAPQRYSTLNKPVPADLPLDNLTSLRDAFLADGKATLANTLISKVDLGQSLVKSNAVGKDGMVFNLQVSTKPTPVTNQKSSGRCWLFATTNVVRTGIVKKFNLGEFELSQSYLFFYDSLEKANYFLELAIELAEEPLDSRLLAHLFTSPENDGGQWDMVVNLIEKYGLVPKSVYPESYHSSNTSRLDGFLTSKLRDFALELRSLYAKGKKSHLAQSVGSTDEEARKVGVATARSAKGEMMAAIYRVLAITLGAPPPTDEPFLWEYNDKDGKAHSLSASPLEFYHEHCAGFKASDYISLINDPRNAYDKLYTVDRLGNVWGGRPVLYVNTTTEMLKEVIVRMIKADKPVWFGCDVGKMSNSQLGIMDPELYDYDNALGCGVGMTKAERLQSQDSAMTHAMVIPAVHVDDDGKIVRAKVENSWSDTAGDHGYFVMTDRWIDEYLFQIVVPRNMVPSSLRKVFESNDATVLPAWDPMGSLA